VDHAFVGVPERERYAEGMRARRPRAKPLTHGGARRWVARSRSSKAQG